MTETITVLYCLAAVLPIIALVWSALEVRSDAKKQDAIKPGTRGYLNMTNSAEWVLSGQKTARNRHLRDLILVGAGVTIASLAGILSLPPA